MKNSRLYFKPVLVILLVGLMISCNDEKEGASKTQAPRSIQAIQAEGVNPITSKMTQKASSTGTFIAEDQVMISSETAGYLKQILFKEGDFKKKGVLLAKMNDAELQAQKTKLEVQLEYAKQEHGRAQRLVDIQAINSEELDRLDHEVKIIEADIQIINVEIEQTNIYAPFSGRVGIKLYSEGAYLSAGSGIAELHRTNPLKLEFFVPEKMAYNIKIGDEIRFAVPSLKDTLSAKVYLKNPTLETSNRSVGFRSRVENKDNRLMPGGYADVFFQLESSAESLLIPAESIIPVIDGQKVLLSKGGKVVSQKVEVGMRTPDYVQILGGLSKQDTILVTGILSATDGASVHVTLKEMN